MGCDIHAHIEVKINDKWEHYSAPKIRRNYNVFTFMANVRNFYESGIKPISEPRGIPADVTVVTRLEYEMLGSDAHSASYLNLDELSQLEKFLESQQEKFNPNVFYYAGLEIGYLFGSSFTGVINSREDIPPEVQDARMVFWFDN